LWGDVGGDAYLSEVLGTLMLAGFSVAGTASLSTRNGSIQGRTTGGYADLKATSAIFTAVGGGIGKAAMATVSADPLVLKVSSLQASADAGDLLFSARTVKSSRHIRRWLLQRLRSTGCLILWTSASTAALSEEPQPAGNWAGGQHDHETGESNYVVRQTWKQLHKSSDCRLIAARRRKHLRHEHAGEGLPCRRDLSQRLHLVSAHFLTIDQGGATRPADSCETGGTSIHRILPAKEGHAMKRHLDRLIQALVFIRLGQQLGTDSDLAQAVAHSIDLLVSTLSRFLA